MKHLRKNRKFGRTADYRKRFLWNLVVNLITKERIRTTESRAKEIRPIAERAVTRAKNDTLANRRLLLKYMTAKTVNKLFKELAPRFEKRSGGYTRIMKIGARKNDAAEMVLIEFIK